MKINMKILLVCNAGMSTGIMKMKLEQEAKTRGLDASVDAIPMVELGDNLEGTSVILLGPQIRFALDDIKKTGRRNSGNGNCCSGFWNDECKKSFG